MKTKRKWVIGLSGPSTCGKSTLAALLLQLLPNCVLICQDTFYKTDACIPQRDGVMDWDCPEALDMNGLKEAILDAQPVDRHLNDVSVEYDWLKDLRNETITWTDDSFVIVDGFLLYHDSSLCDFIDIPFFLNISYDAAKERRSARSGYTTKEGFWSDPPGYFDHFVWPNYIKYNQQVFQDKTINVIDTEHASIEQSLRNMIDRIKSDLL